MRKNIIFVFLATMAIMAASCKKEQLEPELEVKHKPITLNATYGNGEGNAKVSYSESGNSISASWEDNDEIWVVYDGYVSVLHATYPRYGVFQGDLIYTHEPTSSSILRFYVRDARNQASLTFDSDSNIVYSNAAFRSQDGTLAGAGKCNTFFGMSTYSAEGVLSCTFAVNTSIVKFTLTNHGCNAGDSATLTYKSGGVEVAKARFEMPSGNKLVYLAVPAGAYSGDQTVSLTPDGDNAKNYTLGGYVNFKAGQTYEKTVDYIKYMPLTFEAREANTKVQFAGTPSYKGKGNEKSNADNMQYKLGNGEWTAYNGTTITLANAGDKVSFRCTGTNTTLNGAWFHNTYSGSYYVYGNVMSLLYNDFGAQTVLPSNSIFRGLFQNNTRLYSHNTLPLMLPATTLTANCYESMFYYCENLTKAPELPATTMAQECYKEMFYYCHNMTVAPELPAETLANNCYQHMFYACEGLAVAPALPATTLAQGCYKQMFDYCSGLVTAPALQATTLAQECYYQMFQRCTSLTTAPALPATTLANSCYYEMFCSCDHLTTVPSFSATTLAPYCCYNMFYDCERLTSVPATLPATTLVTGCYGGMFGECYSLASAPALPATTLANYCYSSMFENCTALTAAPALPATTLAEGCYRRMFVGCTSLKIAPKLPAETLAEECYYEMFRVCSNLNSVRCSATDISASECTKDWLYGVASTGTFGKVNSASWTTGNSGIPTGWIPTLPGKFSVSASQQVYFSQGNLQYIGSASTPYWKFAENQWVCLRTTTGQNSTSQTVDRDLFGWGTSGYCHGATAYQPWSAATDAGQNGRFYAYGDASKNLNDDDGRADWGYNAISNGGNRENCGWRTLTYSECVYLLNTRTTPSGIRFVKAQVNSNNGIIILPDDWNTSYYSLNYPNNGGKGYTVNQITLDNWNTCLEAHGAVFLPVGGILYKSGSNIIVNWSTSTGCYLTSTRYSNTQVQDIRINSSNADIGSDHQNRANGNSVRLAINVQ